MKSILPIFGVMVLVGVAYGLAFFGILPTQKMADNSPELAKTLIAMHLAKAKKPHLAAAKHTAPAAISPEQEALNTQKKQLADGQAQLAKAQADFEAQKQQAAAAPASVSAVTPADSQAKLNAIYAAMSPDDLVTIFTKLPDPDVVGALMTLDEKKAGKVLAGLPPTRAAHLTQEMSHPRPVSRAVASL
jgi:flagellar motility protein MotE (MotC chaperone)